MANNRKEAEAYILKYIEKILPGGANAQIYRELFDSMSDKDFDLFMTQIEEGSTRLAIITPNLDDVKLDLDRNLKIGDELNHNFFERLWIENPDGSKYLSPVEYLIVDLPLRRQAQLLVKKISIPEDNKSVDDYTGQPTGKSKGSKISYPEVQIMAAMNLDHCLTEFMKYRGGDVKGFDAMNASISKTGGVSQKAIEPLAGGVKSTETLNIFLTCMHISNTLTK